MKGMLRTMAVVAVLFLAPALAFGANGDTINIGGSVPLVLSLTLTPDPNADNLTLHAPAAPATATIATIDVTTNNTGGWELYAYSATADAGTTSVLENADGNEIGYTVTFTSDGGANLTDTAIPNGGQMLTEYATNETEAASPLVINYPQAQNYSAGYYSDQLTIVLRAK